MGERQLSAQEPASQSVLAEQASTKPEDTQTELEPDDRWHDSDYDRIWNKRSSSARRDEQAIQAQDAASASSQVVVGADLIDAEVSKFTQSTFWTLPLSEGERQAENLLERLRDRSSGFASWLTSAVETRARLDAAAQSLAEVEARFHVPVVPRAEWGAVEPDTSKDPKWAEYNMSPLPYWRIVIHHTADPQSQSPGDVQAKQLKKGFTDVAYHYIVGGDGTVYEGRRIEAVGAHAGDIKGNHDITKDPDYSSIGIVLTGDFESRFVNAWQPDTPSPRQQASLQTLLNELTLKYGIATKNIIGHGAIDPGHTDCPGTNMTPVVANSRDATAEAHIALQQARGKLAAIQVEVERLKARAP